MDKKSSLLIVGHQDAAQAALYRHFSALGWTVFSSAQGAFDVLDRVKGEAFFVREKPAYVILGSVRSGGIAANQEFPAEFMYENTLAQANIIDLAYRHGVKKLLYLAASCIYPKDCLQPMREEYFQTGPMEPTSEPYSMAKAGGVLMCQAYRTQYGFRAVVGVPATVYGPGGHEDARDMHVLGAMLAKFHMAVAAKESALTFWGSGAPRREFIHADDLARACAFLLETYDERAIINIGAGEDVTIKELAALVADATGFNGEIRWDSSRPDGASRKWLDSSRLFDLGWRPSIGLKEGIRSCL